MKVGQVNSLVLESLENKSRICKTQKQFPLLLYLSSSQWLVGYPKNRKTDRKFQNPNRTETENYRFFKNRTEPKPNSKTAVNRKGPLLTFLGEIQEKIRKNIAISVGIVEKTLKP